MGFNESYKVLSPIFSWDASAGHKQQVTQRNNASNLKQQKVLEFVRRWLLCGGAGWVFDSSDYAPVTSPGKCKPSSSPDGYVKPPKWKQLARKLRAKSKKARTACCEGLCFHPPQQELNYCSTDSYERNFDRGREYWENPTLFLSSSSKSTSAAFAPHSAIARDGLKSASSGTPMSWDDRMGDRLFVNLSQGRLINVAAG